MTSSTNIACILILIYLFLSVYEGTLNFTEWGFPSPKYSNLSLNSQGRTGVYVSSVGGGGGSSVPSDSTMVRIYDSAATSVEVDQVDWGLCYVAQAKTKILYLKNVYTSNISLGLSTTNWVPENASDYLSINWDYMNQTIMPNEVLPLKLRLWVAANTTGITNFSCNMMIWIYERSL